MSDETKVLEIVVKTIGDADIKALAKELANVRKEAQASRKSLEDAERGVRNLGQQAAASRKQLKDIHESLGGFATTLKHVGGLIGVGFTLKGLIAASEQVQQLNAQMKELGETFIDAAFQASGFTEALSDPESWLDMREGAIALGNYIGGVFKLLKDGAVFAGELISYFPGIKQLYELLSSDDFTALTPPPMTEDIYQSIADSTSQIKINVDDTAKYMKDAADQARYWAEFDREMRANSREALAAESKSAALDARRNTRQFGYNPSQLKADMDEVATSAALVESSMGSIDADLAAVVENSTGFRDTWDELANSAYTWEDALRMAVDELQTINDLQGDILNQARTWAAVLSDSFTAVLEGQLHNTRDLLRSITTEMRNFYAEMAARAAAQQVLGMVQGLMGLASLASGAGSFTSLMSPQAKGNAFSAGNVVPLARGGIVSAPTLFPMARGMGLMGEAGPEAVMPLKRGSDGRLGVAAGRSNVVIENHGAPVTASVNDDSGEMRIILRAANLGANMAQERINRSVRTGYGATAQSMQSSYGLRRRGGG